MLTAKYYKGLSATTRGTPIAWQWGDRASHAGKLDNLPVEAVWGDAGATCVSHSRLWRENKVVYVPQPVKELFEPFPKKEMPERQFLKVICGETKGSAGSDGSAAQEAGAMPGLVNEECPVKDGELVSRAPEHSAEDNSIILF